MVEQTGAESFFSIFGFLIAVAAYVYYSFCLMVIANKTGTENSWLVWIRNIDAHTDCQSDHSRLPGIF